MQKVVLCGYMGSGKSSVGRELAKISGLEFVDLDDFLEKKEGMSISDLVSGKGEMYFRRKESDYFRRLMQSDQNIILSLGGGTPAYAGNHELLADPNVTSVYLKTSIGKLLERLQDEMAHRPLLSGKSEEELQEFVAKHLFERQPYYHNSRFVVVTDGKSPEEIALEILNLSA